MFPFRIQRVSVAVGDCAGALRRLAGVAWAAGLLVLVAPPVEAQPGSITGKVTEAKSGQPITGARVLAVAGVNTVASTTTREDGTYRLTGLVAGSYVLSALRIGFSPTRTAAVAVTAGGTATADIQMTEAAMELNPVVTVASRKEEKALTAPASVAVVDVREMQERPSITVADHLQGVAGVDISKGGVAQSNIVARGFNNAFSGQILTLQDYRFAGVPSLRVNVPLLFTASNEDIERVEVLLGPASALYGPNSSHGVLHVITKSPFTSQGTTLTLDGGTQQLLRGSLRHAGVLSERLGYKISGEYLTARDWKNFTAHDSSGLTIARYDPGEPDVFPAAAPAGRRGTENVRDFDIKRYVGEGRVDFHPTNNSEFVSTLGMSHIGSGLEYTGANGTALARNWTYISAQQRMRIGRLFAQVFANLSDAGNKDSLDLAGTYLLRSGQPIVDQSRVYAAQVQHGLTLGGRQDFVYGLDYISTNPRTGNTINGRNEEIDDVREVGGYVQSTTNLTKKWDFIAALRLDNNNQIDGSQFSPRAALVFKPTETQNLRFTYNRAYSTPANFTWFLDLIQLRNVSGTPYNVRALGNPPKTGWSFNRSCDPTVSGGLCMRTIFTGAAGENTWVPASAAVAYRGVIGANATALVTGLVPQIQGGLGVNAATAQALAQQIVTYLGGLQPTPAQIGTEIRFLGAPSNANLTPAQITDIAPIKASFNNTYEFGYKGIVNNRLRLAVDAWQEKRGDVGNPAGLATPTVYWDTVSVKQYLTAALIPAITGALQQQGMPAQQAQATAQAFAPLVARGVAAPFAPLPLGIISFDSPVFASARDVYATYTTYNKTITVAGLDLAADLVTDNNWTFSGTYSMVLRCKKPGVESMLHCQKGLVYPNVTSSNQLPLMLNAPDHKMTVAAKFHDENKGWGFETRVRYANGYPVNSGVYTTGVAFPRGGTTGTYFYDAIHAATLFDVNLSKRFHAGGVREIFWSINGENVFNHPYRTLPGMPLLGRMVVTRLQYQF